MARRAWEPQSMGLQRVRQDLETKPPPSPGKPLDGKQGLLRRSDLSEDLKKGRDLALRVSGNPAFQAVEIAKVSKKKIQHKHQEVATQKIRNLRRGQGKEAGGHACLC